MKFKISCPHCSHTFSLADPKPGKYKPKCSNCGTQFAIVVEAGETPKIRVGKLATPSKQPEVVADSSKAVVESSSLTGPTEVPNPTIDSSLPPPLDDPSRNSTSKTSEIEETLAPDARLAPQLTQPTGFEVTIAPPCESNAKPSGFDVTLDGESQSITRGQTIDRTMPIASSSKSVSPSPATVESAGDFSVNDGSAGTSSRKQTESEEPIEKLGGYRILKVLGAGGMGKVYLARQLSLDRACAIKTIQADWASNPKAIARFIREAYAAAQLTHHNVVQIYDLGQDKGTNFFSMELVGGGSLDDQLKSKGKFPPKLAATLILQAARGLKFAHDHGMVHRDIKPANLMLTNDGLVKIADMGLVKTPHSEETSAEDQADVQSMMLASAKTQVTVIGASMGTPAYMSPEQAEDAASVDKRADIYSLGCTFYALLTGKPPFDGQTLLEVISKHRQEKITRPEVVVSGLPPILGDIIERMTAKQPDDRYQDLDDVVHDLEVFLELREDTPKAKISYFDPRDRPESVSSSKEFNEKLGSTKSKAEGSTTIEPTDIPPELAGKIQLAARNFQTSPLLYVRRLAPLAWITLCALMGVSALLLALVSGGKLLAEGAKSIASSATEAVGSLTGANDRAATTATPASQTSSNETSNFDSLLSRTKSALGYFWALIIGPVSAVAFGGWERKSPLAQRYRESFFSGGILNIIYWFFLSALAILVVHFLGLWIPAVLGILFGTLAGAAYYFGIEKPLARRRRDALESSQGLLKQLRLRGMEEDQVQHAFAKHSGSDWEELFENVFGYECMRGMRSKLQKTNSVSRKSFRPYRDRLIDRWDVRLSESKRASEEALLAKMEKAELVAGGMPASDAKRQADAVAASLVDAAAETKQAMKDLAAGSLTDQAAEDKRLRIKQMLADARSGKVSKKERRSRAVDAMLGQLLGSKFRFACAAALLAATGMWVSANRQSLENYWVQAKSTVSSITVDGGLQGVADSAKNTIAQSADQLWTPVFGGLVSQNNVLYVALAGILMIWGALCYGWKKSLLFVPLVLFVLCIPLII